MCLSLLFIYRKPLFNVCPLLLLKVIGGELQERLIPVPYSKSSTDQAVSRFPTIYLFLSAMWLIWWIIID